MDKDKSILERFTETMKGLADSASEALKSEEPAKADQTAAASMPFAAEGMVSDPLLVPPVAAQPVRKKRRVARKAAPRSATTAKTSARKAAKKAAASRSRKSAGKAATASARKATARKAGRVSAKKHSKKAAKRRR